MGKLLIKLSPHQEIAKKTESAHLYELEDMVFIITTTVITS